MARNIFDNEIFFNNYMELRNGGQNYNELLEQPAMRAHLPELADKSVLDLGCGYGDNCRDFIRREMCIRDRFLYSRANSRALAMAPSIPFFPSVRTSSAP